MSFSYWLKGYLLSRLFLLFLVCFLVGFSSPHIWFCAFIFPLSPPHHRQNAPHTELLPDDTPASVASSRCPGPSGGGREESKLSVSDKKQESAAGSGEPRQDLLSSEPSIPTWTMNGDFTRPPHIVPVVLCPFCQILAPRRRQNMFLNSAPGSHGSISLDSSYPQVVLFLRLTWVMP